MAKKEQKVKEIMFSEEIDSAINGYAFGLSFTGIGVFLLLKPDYFTSPIASYIIGAVIGAFGVLGTGIELSKSAKVKGLRNVIIGMVFLTVWAVSCWYIHALLLNILMFVVLILGCYAVCLGLIQSAVSITKNLQKKKGEAGSDKKGVAGSAVTQIVLFLTQLCGLAIAVINVVKAFGG